jgi:hypothetical protein
MWKNVVNRDIISAISQNQSTSENNFWIDMTGYDFTRFAFQGCLSSSKMKFPQFFRCQILTLRWQLTSEIAWH